MPASLTKTIEPSLYSQSPVTVALEKYYRAQQESGDESLAGLQELAGSSLIPLYLAPEGAYLLDQTAIPYEKTFVCFHTAAEMDQAIQTMVVRGAPAIGIAGAYGMVLSARQAVQHTLPLPEMVAQLNTDAERLRQSRPTAVNLMWAIDEQLKVLEQGVLSKDTPQALLERLTQRACEIHCEDILANRTMGQHGRPLIPQGASVLTHCNAGAIATGGYGTALGVIRAAFAEDRTVSVYADETRPRLQGMRLTAWELAEDSIPVTLLSDNMAGYWMQQGKIDCVIVGADRITARGDVANKIGTYSVAVLAKAHNIPFYVAAPASTFDLSIESGEEILIEERSHEELWHIDAQLLEQKGIPGVKTVNPGFDTTPAEWITAIITEKGVIQGDLKAGIAALLK